MRLINSDENILQVLEQSNRYLESNKDLSFRITSLLSVFHSLEDLMPQTVEKFWSGHMFPIVEANSELENSIMLCKLGFYKHAFIALRSVLELGLLSVYWDIDGRSHVDIQKWLHSFENTPRKKTMYTKLKTNQNFRKFDDKHEIFNDIENIFKQLSNFVHTKGRSHSNMDLGNSTCNRFNENSLLKWSELVTKVAKSVTTLHILEYPVALQYTPIEQKFGINGPAGIFLEPYQVERIRQFFDKDIMETLQDISDNDPEAKSLAQWVSEQPDISEVEFQTQIEEFEKMEKKISNRDHE